MAVYLRLRDKQTSEIYAGPKLIEIDERLARAMGREPDREHWFHEWMGWAGFAMAVRSDKPIADALSYFMVHDKCFGAPPPLTIAVCQWFIDNFDNAS